MRKPRKLKKQINKAKIILDVRSKPNQLSIEEWLFYFEKTGVLYYDSENGGNVPQILNSKLKPRIYDKTK